MPAIVSTIPVHAPCTSFSSPNGDDVLIVQPNLNATFSLTGTHLRIVPPGWSYPRHDHPYFELILQEQGEQHNRLTGRSLTQRPGDVLLLCPFDAHASSAPSAASFYCVHFDVDELALRRLLCRAGTRLIDGESDSGRRVREALQSLRTVAGPEAATPESMLVYRLRSGAALFEVLARLAEAFLQEDGTLPELSQVALQTASRLAELIQRETERGESSVCIESAIRRLGYHPDYGNMLFRQVYGMSARQYRSLVKLKRAKTLLLDNEMSVQSVAERMGYSDTAHFSRQFKRWTGMSPIAYRSNTGIAGKAEANIPQDFAMPAV